MNIGYFMYSNIIIREEYVILFIALLFRNACVILCAAIFCIVFYLLNRF